MWKFRLTKAQYEALHEEQRKMYKADGEGYKLDLSDEDDPVELKRAKLRETTEATTQKKRADDLQIEFDAYKKANDAGDVNTITRSYEEKLSKQKNDDAAEKTRLTEIARKASIKGESQRIASNLCGENAEAILPHVQSRLDVDLSGDEPIVRVKDKAGKLSALSFDDLEKEFVDNKVFSGIIVASKAKGGADGKNNKGGSSGGAGDKAFKDLTEAERVALYKADPEKFKRLSDENIALTRRF